MGVGLAREVLLIPHHKKIAWTRINTKLKSLATEEYNKHEINLFRPGFLEKASKRIEVDKTIEKAYTGQKGSLVRPARRQMTNWICADFYPKELLRSTAAGTFSTSSRTTLTTGSNPGGTFKGQRNRLWNRQEWRNPNRPSSLTHRPPFITRPCSYSTSTLHQPTPSSRLSQALLHQLGKNNRR